MNDKRMVVKRRREVYEEQLSMFIAILLEQKRKFLVSERFGSGLSTDPYIRKIEYYANADDEKQIDKFMQELVLLGRRN